MNGSTNASTIERPETEAIIQTEIESDQSYRDRIWPVAAQRAGMLANNPFFRIGIYAMTGATLDECGRKYGLVRVHIHTCSLGGRR